MGGDLGHAHGLSRQQLPQPERQGLRRVRGQGHRRRARDRRPSRRLAVQGQRDQARGADRPGADRRAAALGAPERGGGVRLRLGAVPRHQLRGVGPALGGGQADHRGDPGRAEPGPPVRGPLAAAGPLHQEAAGVGERPAGRQVPLVQRRDRAHGRADGRGAGADRGGGAVPGARHRRGRQLHLLGLDRLRPQGLGAHDPLVRRRRLAAAQLGVRQQGRVGRRWTKRRSRRSADCAAEAGDGRHRRSRRGSTTGTRSSSPPTA